MTGVAMPSAGALAIYKKSIVTRSYLFDDGMVALQNALAEVGEAPDLGPLRARFSADVGAAEAIAALDKAAPVYRARLWPGHQAAAHAWIAQAEPLVARHGTAISARLAALYGTVWPAEPVPVDVLPAAGDTGAYTTVEPTRVSVAASDPRHQGVRGLEIVFHEASHGWDGTLERALDAEAGRLGVTLPRQLWHAVLFYLAGEVVRLELERSGVPGYRPYIDEEQLWRRSWAGLRDPVAAACDPWIRGERTRDQALAALVASLRSAGP